MGCFTRICSVLAVVIVCQAVPQNTVNYIASSLKVRYDVINNLVWPPQARITLVNNGNQTIQKGDWELVFSHIRFVESSKLKFNQDGVQVGSVKFYHVNGVLYKMAPAANFTDLAPQAEVTVNFNPGGTQIATTDIMPDWYVSSQGRTSKTITSTTGESLSFVGPFDTKEKWKRSNADLYNGGYTPQERYKKNEMEDLKSAPIRVIPTPVSVRMSGTGRKVDMGTGDWVIVAPDHLMREAELLRGETDIKIQNTTDTRTSRYVELKNGSITGVTDMEGYELVSDAVKQKVTITGVSRAGVFYGIQSLMALLAQSKSIPSGSIKDYPRFEWRGLHYDNARNFQGKEHIFRLLDAMGRYKLNKLHFHLTDDEGWRLEIPGLEELTKVAGMRCDDLTERRCIISQLGSGPSTGTSGSGYLTVSEYRTILQYAADRNIEVIPEFDMPGHCHAAVAAMKEKARKTGNSDYILHDVNDTSKYYSVQSFTDNAINPCIESTYRFVQHLVTRVKRLHEKIQPLRIFHFGGDEVAHDAWADSPACNKTRQDLNITTNKDLKELFAKRVSNITKEEGLDMAAWEDGLLGEGDVPYDRAGMVNDNVFIHAWSNIWEEGNGKRAYVLANAGYKVILSPATNVYFDHPYEPDPAERGYYWATRYSDEYKVFGFMPDRMYENIDVGKNGEVLNKTHICVPVDVNCPSLTRKENVIGLQGQLWSETVRTVEQFEYMVFPRLVVLSERAWHKAGWESETDISKRNTAKRADFGRFMNTLGYRELLRLDRMGIKYRVPLPGVRYSNGKIEANSLYPGLTISYSIDNGQTWADYKANMPIRPDTTYIFVTRSADNSRMSRSVSIVTPRQPPGGGSTSAKPTFTFTVTCLCLLVIQTCRHNL